MSLQTKKQKKLYGSSAEDIGKSGIWRSNQRGPQTWQLNSDGTYNETVEGSSTISSGITASVDNQYNVLRGNGVNDPSVSGVHGMQFFIWGSGGIGDAADHRKADPGKYVFSVDMGSETMRILGLGKSFGSRPSLRGPEYDDYFSHAKEMSGKAREGSENDPTRNYGIGAEYIIDDEGTSVIKNANGTIDTIRRDYNRHTIDTVKEKIKE